MKPRLWDYLKAAFNARPMGMLIPPNWVGVAAFGIFGFLNPGFWLLGAGLELGYLYTLISNARFRRVIDNRFSSVKEQTGQVQLGELLSRLESEAREAYGAMVKRCHGILGQQATGGKNPAGVAAQGEAFNRLLWIYVRLLLTKQSLCRLIDESGEAEEKRIAERRMELAERIKQEGIPEDLRQSLQGQLEILEQRLAKRREAREKLTFVEAEMQRLKQQVELLREQTLVSTSPETVSNRIDQITATLSGTTQWMGEQQRMLGEFEDLMEPPPLLWPSQQKAKESQ
jgi:hypothetical protein